MANPPTSSNSTSTPAVPAAAARVPSSLQSGLSRVLTACTLAAAVVGLVGVAALLVRGTGEPVPQGTFVPALQVYRAPVSILRGVATGDALAIMQLAVVILIATPVLRVVFALITFAIQRDRLYILVSAVVLVGLALGLTGLVE